MYTQNNKYMYKNDKWVPIMSKGKKNDKSQRFWSDFKDLKKIRDNEAIHIKSQFNSIKHSIFLKRINKVRSLVNLLIKLHIIFGERIPRIIIRTAYSPEIELIKENYA